MSWISPDSLDMLAATAGLPEQLEVSAAAAWDVTGLPSPVGLGSIAVLGMGGSGVAGEILQAIGKEQLRLPVVLVGDYSLPAFVGPDTLVFAVSFSGETEETLETTAARCSVEPGSSPSRAGGAWPNWPWRTGPRCSRPWAGFLNREPAWRRWRRLCSWPWSASVSWRGWPRPSAPRSRS